MTTLINPNNVFDGLMSRTSMFIINLDPRVDIDNSGTIFIKNYDAITEKEYAEISRLMYRLGYDWRGAEDAKELLMRDVYVQNGFPYGEDMNMAIVKALNLNLSVAQDEEEGGLDPDYLFDKAKEEFSTTNDPNSAGWLLPDGSLLDFSGGSPYGGRGADHREITHIDDSLSDGSDGMIQFLNIGAIRLGPTNGELWLDISDTNAPTNEQYSTLKGLLDFFNGNARVQISGPSGNQITSKNYGTAVTDMIDPDNVGGNVGQIINEIKRAIRTGNFPQSSVSDFR